MKVTDFLDRSAALFPERDIVHDGTSGMTYRDFARVTHQIANALHAEGIGTGCRVAVYSPNHALGFAAKFGIIRSGAAFIPLNFRNSAHENAELLNTLEVDWLIYHSAFAEDVQTLRKGCPRVRGYVCIDAPEHNAPMLAQWIEGMPDEAPDHLVQPQDPYAIYTTSGTTGRPKGVFISHLTFEAMTASFASFMRFDHPPVHLVAAPLTHTAGAYAAILLGAGAGVTNIILPSAKPSLILEWIERYKVSTLFLPPTLIYMLLSDPAIGKHDYSSLKYFVYGAASGTYSSSSTDKPKLRCLSP
jgi:acyl-CoA synthetase (AMP-forming)/AMP-acid ligase II